jgi:hypothetical protein
MCTTPRAASPRLDLALWFGTAARAHPARPRAAAPPAAAAARSHAGAPCCTGTHPWPGRPRPPARQPSSQARCPHGHRDETETDGVGWTEAGRPRRQPPPTGLGGKRVMRACGTPRQRQGGHAGGRAWGPSAAQSTNAAARACGHSGLGEQAAEGRVRQCCASALGLRRRGERGSAVRARAGARRGIGQAVGGQRLPGVEGGAVDDKDLLAGGDVGQRRQRVLHGLHPGGGGARISGRAAAAERARPDALRMASVCRMRARAARAGRPAADHLWAV